MPLLFPLSLLSALRHFIVRLVQQIESFSIINGVYRRHAVYKSIGGFILFIPACRSVPSGMISSDPCLHAFCVCMYLSAGTWTVRLKTSSPKNHQTPGLGQPDETPDHGTGGSGIYGATGVIACDERTNRRSPNKQSPGKLLEKLMTFNRRITIIPAIRPLIGPNQAVKTRFTRTVQIILFHIQDPANETV